MALVNETKLRLLVVVVVVVHRHLSQILVKIELICLRYVGLKPPLFLNAYQSTTLLDLHFRMKGMLHLRATRSILIW